jgi:hypothetical protein
MFSPPYRLSFNFYVFFPHKVHFVFSKNCGFPHRLFLHVFISDLPQASHMSTPMNVIPLHDGHATDSDLPHPEHRA